MKEVIVHPGPPLITEIHEVSVPTPPGDDEVVIRVAVAGSNVKGERTFYRRSIHVNDLTRQTGYILRH